MKFKLEYENGKLVKVDGMRPQYLDGHTMIMVIHQLAEELLEERAKYSARVPPKIQFEDNVWLVDLDGTGSMHPCHRDDDGAVEYGPVDNSEALYDIAAERGRQILSEGFTSENDDEYEQGELAQAAVCYAWVATQDKDFRKSFGSPPTMWPVFWDNDWWKPTTPRRDLVKAGALIVAEIQRLDRKSK